MESIVDNKIIECGITETIECGITEISNTFSMPLYYYLHTNYKISHHKLQIILKSLSKKFTFIYCRLNLF